MIALFYIAAAVAVLATILVITRSNPIHALLYFIVSLFAVAVVFFILGAPFAAALEIIIYAGAIMVLFLFVIMLVNIGSGREAEVVGRGGWIGPSLLALVLAGELVWLLLGAGSGGGAAAGRSGSFGGAAGPSPWREGAALAPAVTIDPQTVGRSLFGPYLLGVEMAGLLLLAAMIGAFHLGRRAQEEKGEGQHRGSPGTEGSGRREEQDQERSVAKGGKA